MCGFVPSHTSIMSVSSINLIALIMVSARYDESFVENDPLDTSATHEIIRSWRCLLDLMMWPKLGTFQAANKETKLFVLE